MRLPLILLLSVLGLYLWLARFIHPYADDWSYAVAGMRTQLLPRLWDEYHFWNGRYFSNILVLRGPLVLGLDQGIILYRLVPVMLVLLTWAGAYSFLRAITDHAVDRGHCLLGALLFVLVFLNVMPDLSEGIYWYTGAVTYQLPNALSLFLLASWAGLLRSPARSQGWLIALNVLLVILVVGCNELHMVFMVIFHAGLLLLVRRSSGRVPRAVGAMLLLAMACAAVVYFAPGNEMRGGQFPHRHEFFRSLLWGGLQTGRFLVTWILSPALLLTSLLYIPISRWLEERVPRFRAGFGLRPWMAVAIVVLPVYIAMTLPYWTTGLLGQYRTVNATLFFFLPAWFMMLTVIDQRFLQKRGFPVVPTGRNRMVLSVLLVLALFLTRNAGAIVSDIWNGRLERYDRELTERYGMIREAQASAADQLMVPALTDPPHCLHTLEPTVDPTHWTNRSMAYYFGADTLEITVVPEP